MERFVVCYIVLQRKPSNILQLRSPKKERKKIRISGLKLIEMVGRTSSTGDSKSFKFVLVPFVYFSILTFRVNRSEGWVIQVSCTAHPSLICRVVLRSSFQSWRPNLVGLSSLKRSTGKRDTRALAPSFAPSAFEKNVTSNATGGSIEQRWNSHLWSEQRWNSHLWPPWLRVFNSFFCFMLLVVSSVFLVLISAPSKKKIECSVPCYCHWQCCLGWRKACTLHGIIIWGAYNY